MGDFIGVREHMFTTKTGEISVKLASFVILAKALRPPPEKWHGTHGGLPKSAIASVGLPDFDGERRGVKKPSFCAAQIVREIRNFSIRAALWKSRRR